MAIQPFETIDRRSVAADAVDQIRNLVASGTLAAGQRLPSERTLADLLGVSRPVVREAIRALSTLGVLETRAGSGTYVSDLSAERLASPLAFVLHRNPEALQHLMEVRLLLEVGAAQGAARRRDPDVIAKMQEILERLLRDLDDVTAFVKDDIEFHRALHEACGNPLLLSLMESVAALGEQSRLVTARQRRVREGTLRDHAAILDAVRKHDPSAAGDAMRAHLEHVAPYLSDTR